LDGAGVIGDLIGITDTQFIITTVTTPGAGRFTTGAISTEEEACGAEFVAAPTQEIGPGTSAGAAEFTTIPAERIDLSTETTGLLEDTQNPAVRAGPARGPSAATTMADRQGAFRPAEAPASVAVVVARVVAAEDLGAAEDLTVAVAGINNRGFVLVSSRSSNLEMEKSYAPNEAELRQI
jgi:hypothetical protein